MVSANLLAYGLLPLNREVGCQPAAQEPLSLEQKT